MSLKLIKSRSLDKPLQHLKFWPLGRQIHAARPLGRFTANFTHLYVEWFEVTLFE
jgi:hypothetical protein